MPEGHRIRLLCEDPRTDRFLRKLCKGFNVWVLESEIAPDGRGDASVWVRRRYASSVARLRSRRHQRNLGLIIAIDGDNKGVSERKAELAAELAAMRVPPSADDEPIAIFVPTWSVETWLALLCGAENVTETEPLKNHRDFKNLWEDGTTEAKTISSAVEAWKGDITPLPSLADGYAEATRVWL
jgi:hypothetical protein